MPRGMRSVPRKQRRNVRRQNHIARDLATPKHRTRVVERKDSRDKWHKLISQEDYEDQEDE